MADKSSSRSQEFTKVEDVLESIGGYGRYQKWLSFILIFPQFPTAMIVLSPVFTTSNKVQMYCQSDSYYGDEFGPDCNINCTNSQDPFVYTSIVQQWDLICSRHWIADTITSFQMAGMMTGACVSSLLSDMFGRRLCFIFQTLFMGLLGMLPALAIDPWSYAATRFLAGFGVGACFVVYLSHLMEFLTASWRTICGTVSLWPIGEMILALLAYLIGSWRWLTFATGIPAILLLPFYKFVLESPRWLLIHKRTKEAHDVFSKIAEWNSCSPPDLSEIEQLQSVILKEERDSLRGMRAIKAIMYNSKLRVHMTVLTLCNITCAVVYYGIAFNAKNLSGNPYMNMLYFGIFDLFASPAGIIFNNFIGRRKTFIMYMAAGTTFMITILVLELTHGIDNIPMTINVLSLCGRFGIVAGWGSLTCLILESSPTNLRSTCLGLTACFGYFGGVLSPQLALLGSYSAALPYIILCALTVTSSISSWLFISETLDQPLEDLVED